MDTLGKKTCKNRRTVYRMIHSVSTMTWFVYTYIYIYTHIYTYIGPGFRPIIIIIYTYTILIKNTHGPRELGRVFILFLLVSGIKLRVLRFFY